VGTEGIENQEGEEMMEYENIEKVKRLDFDRLDMLVSERLGALKLLAQGMTESDVHDAVCRDLILPCVYTLAQFLEFMNTGDKEKNNG
jgi:hypothetical protein